MVAGLSMDLWLGTTAVDLQDQDLTVFDDEHSLAAALIVRFSGLLLDQLQASYGGSGSPWPVDGGVRACAPGRTSPPISPSSRTERSAALADDQACRFFCKVFACVYDVRERRDVVYQSPHARCSP